MEVSYIPIAKARGFTTHWIIDDKGIVQRSRAVPFLLQIVSQMNNMTGEHDDKNYITNRHHAEGTSITTGIDHSGQSFFSANKLRRQIA